MSTERDWEQMRTEDGGRSALMSVDVRMGVGSKEIPNRIHIPLALS